MPAVAQTGSLDAIKIALYRDHLDTAPTSLTISFEKLADLLVNYPEESRCAVADGPDKCAGKNCPHKCHSQFPNNPMAWSPVDIIGKRLDTNVRYVTVLVLDHDHVTTDEFAHITQALSPYEHGEYSTHNHRDDDISFRSFIAFSRPVHANEYHRVLYAAVSFLKVKADPTCKNRSRLYFRQSYAKGAPHFARYIKGTPLDVDAVLAWADANLAPESAAFTSERPLPEQTDWDIDGEAVLNAIDLGARYFPHTRRHDLCMAFAGMLRRAGASEEVAEYIVHEIARQGGSDDPDTRAGTVRHTYALDDDGAMTGFTRVADIIGEDVAEEFGDYLTDARNEAFLRGFGASMAASSANPETRALTIVPAPVDVGSLRAIMSDLAAKRARSFERDDKIAAILLRRVLAGRPVTHEGDVETVLDGAEQPVAPDEAIRNIAGTMAFVFPPGTPWEGAAEVLRTSLRATMRDPNNSTRDWLEFAEKTYKRSQQTREISDLQRQKDNAERVEKIRAAVTASATVSAWRTPTQPPDGDDWQSLLEKSKDGTAASTQSNVARILRNHPDFCGMFRWNDVDNCVEVHGGPMAKASQDGLTHLTTALHNYLQEVHRISMPFTDVGRQLIYEARLNHYDPLRDYLLGLTWDGTSRLDTWLHAYCGAEDTAYTRSIGRRWLISCAARGINPGCKVDTMLILESDKQGVGKSTLFEVLGGKWYSASAIEVQNKDSNLLVASSWIIEMAELQGFRSVDFNRMKAFLSQSFDKFRRPYGTDIETSKRRAVLGGTTNERVYLTDNTGNRRYWSVQVGRIDIGAVERDRDQLFAEAVHLYLAADSCDSCTRERGTGKRKRCPEHSWWLSESEEVLAENEAANREEEVAWAFQIYEWWVDMEPTKRPSRLAVNDVSKNALDIPDERLSDRLRTQINVAMNSLKFERKRLPVAGKKHWFFVPTTELINTPQVKKEKRVEARTLWDSNEKKTPVQVPAVGAPPKVN